MINASNLRNGIFFLHDGKPCKVLSYEHIKMARGGAVIKVKAKELLTGVIKQISFGNNERVEEADVENKNLQFLYTDGKTLYFMNMEDYSQTELPVDRAVKESVFLTENKNFQVVFFQGEPISIILPASMFFRVAESTPAVRGNTASSATKMVVLENGLKIEVPQFIKKGDVVKVNTEKGEYMSRGNR